MSDNPKKKDLRIQRTQKAIIDTFYELLDEKSFNNITVIDICDRALINRGTFYTHFEDKYQLLDKCIYDIMIGFDDEVDKVHGDSDLLVYYRDVIDVGMAFLIAHRKRIRTIIVKADSTLIFNKVHEILVKNIVGKVGKLPHSEYEEPVPVEIIAQFFSGGVIQLVKWWLLDESKFDASEIKEQLTRLIQHTIIDYYGTGKKVQD